MPKPRPKPQARGLAAGLREARKTTSLSTTAVAAQLGWSQATVSRIETGKRNTTPEEVVALLAVYGVTGRERDRLVALARDSDRPNWLETQHDTVPAQAWTLAQYEAEAVEIIEFGLITVPGLLQTASYIRAVMNSVGVPAVTIEPRVRLRLDRQSVLDRSTPPRFLAILDEAALHRRIGGRRVMVDQLRHLTTMAARPNVDVRVIPFDHGGHPGINGAFMVVRFDQGRPVVHLEHSRSSLFLEQPADVAPYEDATARLLAVALEADMSIDLIGEVLARFEQE